MTTLLQRVAKREARWLTEDTRCADKREALAERVRQRAAAANTKHRESVRAARQTTKVAPMLPALIHKALIVWDGLSPADAAYALTTMPRAWRAGFRKALDARRKLSLTPAAHITSMGDCVALAQRAARLRDKLP